MNDAPSVDDELIGRLDGFTAMQRDEVAKALWALWAALDDQFGGFDAFVEADADLRDRYLNRLAEVADRTAAHRDTPKGHLHYAVALMLRYVGAWVAPDTYAVTGELSGRIAELIEHGRALAATPEKTATIPRGVIKAGFTSSPVNPDSVRAGEIEPPRRDGPALIAYFDAVALKAGDVQRVVLKGPAGQILSEAANPPLAEDTSGYVFYSGKRTPPGNWYPGVYEAIYTVTHGASVVLEHRTLTALEDEEDLDENFRPARA